MREDALALKMQFSDISIRPLRHLPPITGARADFIMSGTSFRAGLSDGQMILSDPSNAENDRTVKVTKGKLEVANYRAQGAPSAISFDASGDLGIILHHLNQPPLALLRNVDFELTRLSGQVRATTVLKMPLFRPKPGDIVFQSYRHRLRRCDCRKAGCLSNRQYQRICGFGRARFQYYRPRSGQ